jgi:hypothetical protein
MLLIENFPLPDHTSAKNTSGGTLLEILWYEFLTYEIKAELGKNAIRAGHPIGQKRENWPDHMGPDCDLS